MSIYASIVVGVVALIHLYIVWLEMFAWTTRAPKVFTTLSPELFPKTKALAANQGLYNGFLVAGLIWSFFIDDAQWQQNIALCFLLFVAIAGLYGAMTASRKILYVQFVPAAIGIALILFT